MIRIVSDTSEVDSASINMDNDIIKAFVGTVCNSVKWLIINALFFVITGYFTLPVSCLVEPSPSRLLRPVDDIFVEKLIMMMKENPSTDAAPIVGLAVVNEGYVTT